MGLAWIFPEERGCCFSQMSAPSMGGGQAERREEAKQSAPSPPASASTGGGQAMRAVATAAPWAAKEHQPQPLDAALPRHSSFRPLQVLYGSAVDSITITTLMVQALAHNIIFSWAVVMLVLSRLIVRPLQGLSHYQKARSGVTVRNLFAAGDGQAMLNRVMLPLSRRFVLVYLQDDTMF